MINPSIVMPTTNKAETLAWIHAEHFQAQSAINDLLASFKEVSQDYRLRIRAMREYQNKLEHAADSDQLELFNQSEVLTVDIRRIKVAPLAGLR